VKVRNHIFYLSLGFFGSVVIIGTILPAITMLIDLARPMAERCDAYYYSPTLEQAEPYPECARTDLRIMDFIAMQAFLLPWLLLLIAILARSRSKENIRPILMTSIAIILNLPSLLLAFDLSRGQDGGNWWAMFIFTAPFNLVALIFSILSFNRIKRDAGNYVLARNMFVISLITSLPLALLICQILFVSSWGDNVNPFPP